MAYLSPQSLDALAEIISGGSANDNKPSIGLYRSGPKIEKFMRGCNINFQIGNASRVPSLVDCLLNLNNADDADEILPRIIEASADPRDFIDDTDRHSAVLDYLNRFLAFDNLELRNDGRRARLVKAGQNAPVLEKLSGVSDTINFDTVQRDLDRALTSADSDPEDAVTAACSVVESVCRSILIEIGEELPAKKDVKGLYNAIRGPLGLAPNKLDNIDPLIADDVRKILSGIASTIDGIGALRTHAGDAHGREAGYARIDRRIASLAIHAASTASLFIIETWQRKYPMKPLTKH